jgi:hypothetical protein
MLYRGKATHLSCEVDCCHCLVYLSFELMSVCKFFFAKESRQPEKDFNN